MKLGIVVHNDFPVDVEVRPRKLAKLFHDLDRETMIYARDTGDSRDASPGYTNVERFSLFKDYWLLRVAMSSLPLNPFWIIWLAVTLDNDLDAIVVSNIRSGLPSIVAAKVNRVPIILDLQENNAEAQQTRTGSSLLQLPQRNPLLIFLYERFCIRFSNAVWVVVEERRADLIDQGINPEKLFVVSNTPYLPELDELERSDDCWDGVTDFSLVYAGILPEFRGLDLIIGALPEVLERGEEVQLFIAGDGPYKSDLEALAIELCVDEYVKFEGWIPSEQLPAFLQRGDVGVIPHNVNRFTETTVPNKLFDYMSIGLPVLATNMAPVRRIINKAGCGTVLPTDPSSSDVAEAIIDLKTRDFKEIGSRGREAIVAEYNWSSEADAILASIEYVKHHD